MIRRLVVLAAVCAVAAFGQSERGNIAGQVTDSSGAAIAGASVAIIQTGTNTRMELVTNNSGEYNAPSLQPGPYRIEISASGFKRFVQDGVVLAASATVRVDSQLQLGQVSETVEVSALAVQIQTENAKVSTSVQNKMVDELPLVVGGALRSPFDLVSITPESKGGGSAMSLGGGQAAQWDATLDGLSVGTNRSSDTSEAGLISPSVEAITEFTIDTNGFKAEYGQAGGGVMTFVSKSGTNDFHGTVYEFLRNDALDARGFFPLKKSVYKQHDFGGSAGGPIWIPKVYNGRNKTFFFASYEGFRNRIGANDQISSIPTPEMYQGDFSKWVDGSGKLLAIYDPATQRPSGSTFIRDQFPGNQIPLSRFNNFAKSVIPFASPVKPNRPGLVPGTSNWVRNNFISTVGTFTTPTDKGSIRLDHSMGNKNRFSYFYNSTAFRREPGALGPAGLPLPLSDFQSQAYDATAHRFSHDLTITPTMLNHFSIGGNTFIKNSFSPNSGGNWKDKVCLKNAVDCNTNFPVIGFSEFTVWGSATYNGTEQPMWSIKDDFSVIKGKHAMKFGYAFQNQRADGFGQQNISGRADFSFQGTSIPGATSLNSGSSFASFLLGDASAGQTETIRYVAQRYNYHGFYAQDDWRINPRLTLNFGLRYDVTMPPFEGNDQYSDFTPDRPNPAVNGFPGALRFAGFGEGRENTRTLVPGWYAGWGPRIGLAYTLNSSTTIRTGFGRSFSRVTAVQGSGHYSGFIGQYNFATTDQGITPAFNTDKGLPSYPLPPQLDPAFSNNQNVDFWQLSDVARAPESLFWTFSIQRQVSRNLVFEGAYNANVGTHLQTGLINLNQVPTRIWDNLVAQYGSTQAFNIMRSDINSALARSANIPIPYPNFTNPAVQRSRTVNQALRPFPQYLTISTGVQNGDKSGHSSYHAMILRLERRYSNGLTFQWNYTFSKLLTDSDTYFANAVAAQDQYNRTLEKSIGQYDQTHALKLSTLYELPFGKGKRWVNSGFASYIIGGWRLGAIQVYTSGFPIQLQRNNSLSVLFNGTNRPVINSYEGWRAKTIGDHFDPAVDRFLDKSAFPVQPAAQWGNATRYNPKVRAFPNMNENISLAKSFAIGEKRRVDFRAEAFNLFNRTVFGTGSTNLDSNTFGVVTNQVNTARQMQMALKLYW